MSKTEKGGCPFYQYRISANAEILGCLASGEYIPVSDSNSLVKVGQLIDETCLGFDYPQCPHYKQGVSKKGNIEKSVLSSICKKQKKK